jgi:ferredoxin
MVKRQIIKIDEELCTGCGECIPNCPEGALQIIDDKARIISDLFCDGLGACIGHCPVDAISIEEREAEEYSERRVMENVVKQGPNVIKAHLEHLKDHKQMEYYQQAIEYLQENSIAIPMGHEPSEPAPSAQPIPCGCPGSAVQDFTDDAAACKAPEDALPTAKASSQLRQWPVQIMLVPPSAPYLNDSDLLITADCVPFAYPNYHEDFLKDKILLIGCPKLDDSEFYQNKITEIFKANNIKSVTVAHMEVPCCYGMVNLVKNAISESGKDIPYKDITIGVKGKILEEA